MPTHDTISEHTGAIVGAAHKLSETALALRLRAQRYADSCLTAMPVKQIERIADDLLELVGDVASAANGLIYAVGGERDDGNVR